MQGNVLNQLGKKMEIGLDGVHRVAFGTLGGTRSPVVTEIHTHGTTDIFGHILIYK